MEASLAVPEVVADPNRDMLLIAADPYRLYLDLTLVSRGWSLEAAEDIIAFAQVLVEAMHDGLSDQTKQFLAGLMAGPPLPVNPQTGAGIERACIETILDFQQQAA